MGDRCQDRGGSKREDRNPEGILISRPENPRNRRRLREDRTASELCALGIDGYMNMVIHILSGSLRLRVRPAVRDEEGRRGRGTMGEKGGRAEGEKSKGKGGCGEKKRAGGRERQE